MKRYPYPFCHELIKEIMLSKSNMKTDLSPWKYVAAFCQFAPDFAKSMELEIVAQEYHWLQNGKKTITLVSSDVDSIICQLRDSSHNVLDGFTHQSFILQLSKSFWDKNTISCSDILVSVFEYDRYESHVLLPLINSMGIPSVKWSPYFLKCRKILTLSYTVNGDASYCRAVFTDLHINDVLRAKNAKAYAQSAGVMSRYQGYSALSKKELELQYRIVKAVLSLSSPA